MSKNTTVVEELKSLSATKQHMLQAYDEKQHIVANHKELLQEATEAYDARIQEFKGSKADDLTVLLPKKNSIIDKKLPVCEKVKISSSTALFGLVFYLSAVLFILSFFGVKFGIGFSFILVAALFISGILWLAKCGNLSNYFDWEKSIDEWRKEAQATIVSKEEIIRQYVAFEEAFLKTVEEYKCTKESCESQLMLKYEKIVAPDKEQLEALEKTIEEDYKIIENNTLLHKDHIGYIESIVQLLETGRADDLKEAINMAIEEERKIENENERRAEAYRQERILEEQARQNMLHNQEMERAERQRVEAAREHAAKMEAQAKLQAEETRKLRQELERQNRANNRY